MKTRYLLDTNIIIHLLHGKYGIKEKILEVGEKNCYISAITLAELYYGAYFSENVAKSLQGVELISLMFNILPLDKNVLQLYGQSKANLRQQGILIDDFDILIGMTAKSNDMTLITENVKHLGRLPINFTNWITR